MDFRILGPVEASAEGQQLPLGGQRGRALLAYLLLHANEVVAAERLFDQLWDEAPRSGLAALQTQVSRLRKPLGDRIVTSGSGYAIRVEPGELDLGRFRSLLAEAGAAADAATRARLLRDADVLWRGEPLAGLDAPFAAAEASALEELRLAALEDRLEADLELGRNGELISELSGLVTHYPSRERLRGQLILALYRSGRQADALEAYRQTRRMLDEELGLEPGPALRELERAILRHDPALARAPSASVEPPAASTPTARRPRAPVVAAAVVALGSAAVVVALAATGGDKAKRAAPTRSVRVVTEAVVQPVPAATTHHVRRHRRTHVTRTSVAKRIVHHATPKPATTAGTQPAQQATAPVAAPAATKKKTTSATAATAPRVPTSPPAKPVTISDAFSSDIIDPTIWQPVTDANLSIAETDGQLVVTIGPAAVRTGTYSQIDAHVGTACRFPGNFDARVDYTLLEWPQGDNILAQLNAIYIGANVGRESGTQSGDVYMGYVSPDSFNSVPLPDVSGSIRITRVDGIATTYMWHRGGWLRLAEGTARGSAVLGLGASSMDPTSEFGHQEVKVAFDNFSVAAVDPLCPPGSLPGH